MSKKPSETVSLVPAKARKRDVETPCEACEVRDFAVCGAMTPSELTRFGSAMSFINLSPGATLVDEGEPEKYVFSITSGCLKSYKLLPDGRRQVTGFMFPGDFLGLARAEVYPSSVEAVTATSVCRMERAELQKMSDAFPNLERRLHDLASEALAEVQGQILLLGRKTAQERVATFLLGLSERAQIRGCVENPVDVPMSRDDIGDFLGLTTETVSRTFSRLRKQGLIGVDRDKRVELLDIEALQEIAEGL